MKLKNKVAIVTGAASGFGKATALKFAQEGAIQMLVDINEEKLAIAVDEIVKAVPGAEITYMKADVSKEEQVIAYTDATTDKYGKLDIAFINAGILGGVGSIIEHSYEDFISTININLNGVFLGLKYALRHMQQHGGSIIITSSIGGLKALPGSCGYVASKHGVVGLTKIAALEYAQYNVRVNAICPGFFPTPLHIAVASANSGGHPDDYMRENANSVPNKRYGKVEEVGELVAFLASADAQYINGTVIPIDGGVMTI